MYKFNIELKKYNTFQLVAIKMKIKMADNEYFPIGTLLSCSLCNGKKLQGEVMAFDHASRTLVISIHF